MQELQVHIPVVGLCLFPNTRWRHFAIQGYPCIGFWLYYVTSKYKVMSSNTSWQYFQFKVAPVLGLAELPHLIPVQGDNI